MKDKKKKARKKETKPRAPKTRRPAILPDNLEMYWNLPNMDKHSFSRYLVNSVTGDIWSTYKGDFLTPSGESGAYRKVSLVSDSGHILFTYQHRVVLAAKLQSWDFATTHHKSRVRDDNRPDNLEPRTRKEQMDQETRENIYRKLTEESARDIKLGALTAIDKKVYRAEMAKKYGVSTQHIFDVLSGRFWANVNVEVEAIS